MKNISFRIFFVLVLLLIVFGSGIYVARWWWQQQQQLKVQEQSDVLLEKVRAVAKLITVEGQFSELYSYKEIWGYDWSPFRKKALLRIQATVQVGYDLEKMHIEMQPDKRTIIISNLPEPEILSIDHTIDYYDIQEGTFNYFTPEDYSKLNARAKEFIRQKALQSNLLELAVRQGNEMLELIEFMAESAGWKVQYQSDVPIATDSLSAPPG